jgi:ribosomal protein L11 methyltransferase
MLFALGSEGVEEFHPGLALGEDGPLLSGDPGAWAPAPPRAVDGAVELRAYFPDDRAPDTLIGEATEALAPCGASGIVADPLIERDWNAAWKRGFVPLRVSERIVVVPSWCEAPPLGAADRALSLDPGLAFGTGTHFTTAGCLAALDRRLRERPASTVLDVGTGTGILAIAAKLLGADKVVGVDVDTQAIAAASENAARNGVDVSLREGGVELAGGTFHIVVANLLAPLLCALSGPLASALAADGRLIASGLLVRQRGEVEAAMAGVGLRVIAEDTDGTWLVLEFAR